MRYVNDHGIEPETCTYAISIRTSKKIYTGIYKAPLTSETKMRKEKKEKKEKQPNYIEKEIRV